MHYPFDKEKYVQLAKDSGLPAALTLLHRDLNEFERQAYNGDKTEMAARREEIFQIRKFARDLWEAKNN